MHGNRYTGMKSVSNPSDFVEVFLLARISSDGLFRFTIWLHANPSVNTITEGNYENFARGDFKRGF